MTQAQLSAMLESITGHLTARDGAQEEQLQQARLRIASSLLNQKIEATGSEQLFYKASLYSRENIKSDTLQSINNLAHQLIGNAGAEPTENIFVRSVPVLNAAIAGSKPDWAAGVSPAESFGPFLNNEGREIWVDVYRVEKLITLFLGNQPVLLFKASFRGGIFQPANQLSTAYNIVAGSVWINAKFLFASAPAERFIGVQVKGGTLKLNTAPTLQNNQVTINPAAAIEMSLELVQDEDDGAAETSPYGKDARDAVYTLPATWAFTWQNNKANITQVAPSSCNIYGQDIAFSFTPSASTAFKYVNDMLLIPWEASVNEFSFLKNQSPWVLPAETAQLQKSYWVLPTSAINITSPVAASGNGLVMLQCADGLRLSWAGLQEEDIRLAAPAILGSPGDIFIIDAESNGLGASHHLQLWQNNENPHGTTADLLLSEKAPFIFISNSKAAVEVISTFCAADILADRPVKVNGEPFDVASLSCSLMLSGGKNGRRVMLIEDDVQADQANNANIAGAAQQMRLFSIALENALFTVSPLKTFILFGECDDSMTDVKRGNFIVTFTLYSYLPTLPDPYVANLRLWRRGANNDRYNRLAGAAGFNSLLVCFITFAEAEGSNDNVNVSFYFGGTELPNVLDLPTNAPARISGGAARQGNGNSNTPDAASRRPFLQTRSSKSSVFGNLRTTVKLTTDQFAPEVIDNRFPDGIFIREEPELVVDLLAGINNQQEGPRTPEATSAINKKLGENWDNILGRPTDFFSLLDVSSNASQLGVSFGTNWQIFKTGAVRGNDGEVHQVDYNATAYNTAFPFLVEGMNVKLPSNRVRAFTLPLTSWEPEINLTDPDRDEISGQKLPMDPDKGPLYYANDGGPSRIWNNNLTPVPLAPIPLTNALIEDFKSQPDNYTLAAFTLPFGLKAISYISKHYIEPEKPAIENIQPKFRKIPEEDKFKLTGGIQLSLQAGTFGKIDPGNPAENDSKMFPGYIMQDNNLLDWYGIVSYASNLGHRVTEIFNNEFLIEPLSKSKKLNLSRGVPVTRMDVTGYGANMFSNWLSPKAALAQTSQARFDVMLGRTGHEVIQVKSILYPWGIRVVRTITVFRTGSGYVFRTDSGWKAQSDGLFDFSYSYKKNGVFVTKSDTYLFHPGIIRGLFNVRNIKDAPSVTEFNDTNIIATNEDYLNGVKGEWMKNTGPQITESIHCGAVYFDADVEIENVVQGHVNKRVVSKKILGYVQTAPAGKPLTSQQLKNLLNLQNGTIGGDIDCIININNSTQQMRVTRFDVAPSVNEDGSSLVFVAAARGLVILPKDGSWSLVQHNAGTGEVTPLVKDVMVPLIRKGLWQKGNVVDDNTVKDNPVRVAHPMEILRNPATDTINFGYLQNTATQKVLFLTPAYGAGIKKLLSKTPPVFADAYRLMTGEGIFPNIGNAIDNFGKAMPLLNSKDINGNTFRAFAENSLTDGGSKVLELMDVVTNDGNAADIGMSLLKKGANGAIDKALKFLVPPLPDPFSIPLIDTKEFKIYIEYKTGKKNSPPASYTDSKLDFDVNSLAGDVADQWKSRLNNVAMVVDLGDMKRLMTIKGNFDAKKGKESNYEGGPDNIVNGEPANGLPTPEIEFSDALQPLINIMQMLQSLSGGDYKETLKKGLKIAMSNSGEIWQYKFEASKEIATIRFPPTDELYNSAQTPLKLEASLSAGVYFNAALKITTDIGQLLPTAGAFLKFHGGLQVMCYSVGVGSIYAIGAVDVKIAADTQVGPSFYLKFGFGVSIVVSLPVVGNASVTFMIGAEMYADKDKVILTALMLFRGQANLLGGLVCITITIEAKGIVERIGNDTNCSAQVTFAIDISIFLIIDISFSKTWGEDRQIA